MHNYAEVFLCLQNFVSMLIYCCRCHCVHLLCVYLLHVLTFVVLFCLVELMNTLQCSVQCVI